MIIYQNLKYIEIIYYYDLKDKQLFILKKILKIDKKINKLLQCKKI